MISRLFAWLLITPFFASCSTKPKDDTNRRLAGMYKLHTVEIQDATGVWKESEWAKGGESYILYDGLGHMAVQITPKGYKDFNWLNEGQTLNDEIVKEKIDSMSLPELKAAVAEFSSNYAYMANYTIDETARVITHKRITGSIPSMWGTEVKRAFSFSGDTLILKNPTFNMRLVWIREK